MKVMELTKELKAENNKETIDFFKANGFKVTSHMQNLTDEQIDFARANFVPKTKEEEKKNENIDDILAKKAATKIEDEGSEDVKQVRKFSPDEMIACRSVTPWEVLALGVDRKTVYHWNGYGDVDYVAYRDLQALRRTDYITKPMVIIEDADLCYLWRRELKDTYKYYLGVDYPEEFFELEDSDFERMLNNCPDVLKEVIKTTALSMIKGENYPSVQKLTIIDKTLGTCLKETI